MATINNNNVSSSSGDLFLSDLPLHIFDKLVAAPRSIANPDINAESLRQQILSKLGATDYGNKTTTVRELLRISPTTLLSIIDPCLTYAECNKLLSRIHCECAVQPISAMGIIRRNQTTCGKIPTGLPTLDACLHGGLPIGSITEVVGRAGAGKTHLAQQLTILATQCDGGGIYIDAEKKLSLVRLREIAFERMLSNQQQNNHNTVEEEQQHALELAQQVLENVTIHPLLTTRELLDVLDQLEEEIILRNANAAAYNKQREEMTNNIDDASAHRRSLPVRLIVIDSIAAPIRRDFDMMGSSSSSNIAAKRASAIFQIAKRIKNLAYTYQLAVVVINQVGSGSMASSRIDESSRRNNTLDIGDGEFTASLGTAWQHCVTTRIVLEHDNDPHRLHQQQQEQQHGGSVNLPSRTIVSRMATLSKSLVSKRTKLPFELTKQGLCEVSLAQTSP